MQSVPFAITTALLKDLEQREFGEAARTQCLFVTIHILTKFQHFDKTCISASLGLALKICKDDFLVERDFDRANALLSQIFRHKAYEVREIELHIIVLTNAYFEYELLHESLQLVPVPDNFKSITTIKQRLHISEHTTKILDAIYMRESHLLEKYAPDALCRGAFLAAAVFVLRSSKQLSLLHDPIFPLVKQLCNIWSPSKDG